MAESLVRMAEKSLRILPSDEDVSEYHVRGTVQSVSGSSCAVRLGAAEQVTTCSRFCDCKTGDVVLVLVMRSGRAAAVAKLYK